MAYLACTGLSVGYAGTPVVSDVTFSVAAGDAVFVVGENGSGKSTLMKTILGLVLPISGTFRFEDGVRLSEVGYVPQRNESQRDFPASAWEVVLSGRVSRLGTRPFFSRADKQAAQDALERVGAASLRDKPFGVLSGGQQQRVLLARALAVAPKLLVLDEPTTGLDPEASDSLYAQIDMLRAEGVGVLSVTHDVAGALPHATHVLALAEGTARFMPSGEWSVREGIRS